MAKVRVAILGKQQVIREGIIRLLSDDPEFEISGESKSAEGLIEQCSKREPHVVLICCSIPDYGGLGIIQYIHEKLPRSRIVITGDEGVNDELLLGIKMGVRAYLSPDISAHRLLEVLDLVAEGKFVVSPYMTDRLVLAIESLFTHSGKLHVEEIAILTRREKAVLDLVKDGLTNREIAVCLGISEYTVKVHMLNLMEKLHAHTRQQAVSVFSKTQQIIHAIHVN